MSLKKKIIQENRCPISTLEISSGKIPLEEYNDSRVLLEFAGLLTQAGWILRSGSSNDLSKSFGVVVIIYFHSKRW